MANPSPAPAVQLPPVEVTAQQLKKPQPIFETNPLFLHTFADLRSGPMIEAILWRHRYLQDHPQEQAMIVTTGRGNRILSATTVYTQGRAVYGSSNALGDHFLIKGMTTAEVGTAAGLARATEFIIKLRSDYLDIAQPPADPGDREVKIGTPTLGAVLVAAEETGNYRQVGRVADLEGASPGLAVLVLGNILHPFFPGSSTEIVSWTYEALHDLDRAGTVPAALGLVRAEGAGAAVPPFAGFTAVRGEREQVITPAKDFITFNWEGIQYYYHPDVGTWAKPLPANSITGLPDLCVKNGAVMECAYFCATYMRQHPGRRATLVAGDPAAAAYEADGKLGLFIPTLGGFTLAKQYVAALADRDYLGQIRDQVVAAKQQQKPPAGVIPDGMPGDDTDMQMRRVFLAFQAAGISCQLHEEKQPSLEFTWEGITYTYNSSQILASSAASPPTPDQKSHQALAESRYAAAITQPAGTNGRISAQQAAAVLEPLHAALHSSPSIDLYNLMVATWGHCDAKVPENDIATLLAGAALFSRAHDLAFKVALICARNGRRAEAIDLVHRSLAGATEASDRSRLEKLRSILESPPAEAAK